MKLLTNLMLSIGLLSSVAMSQTVVANSQNALQKAYKSTNIRAALTDVCKADVRKGGKLTAAEVNKFCGCQIEIEGRVTNAQKWELQSAINAKKSPSSLAFVQKQNRDLQACLGPQLTKKLHSLTEQAIKQQKR